MGSTATSTGAKPGLGILSTSSIVDKTLPGLLKEFTIIGVASRDKKKGQKFIDDRKITGAIAMTHEEMINHEDIVAVYNPLPTRVRGEYVKKLFEAGKHVYLEKPMGGSYEELCSLQTLASEKNLQWLDGTMWYHSNRTLDIAKAIEAKKIGDVKHVIASFCFKAPTDEWLNGGNGRTNLDQEPMGALGDSGWYPISAILFAYGFREVPIKVVANSWKLNTVNALIEIRGFMWFSDGKTAQFDAGFETSHRSQYEVCGTEGSIVVKDLVGGQGRSGNFAAYEQPYVGSSSYVLGDVVGKDVEVQVKPCDHVDKLVQEFKRCILDGVRSKWPKRSRMVHKTMLAVFDSVKNDGKVIKL